MTNQYALSSAYAGASVVVNDNEPLTKTLLCGSQNTCLNSVRKLIPGGMSQQGPSKKYTEQIGKKSFLATLKEFIESVEGLKHTIMFPVKLQDLDWNQLPAMNSHLQQFVKEEVPQNDLYALYMVLLNAKSELVTGCDAAGHDVVNESLMGKQLAGVFDTLRKMTELSENLKGLYESSLRPSD